MQKKRIKKNINGILLLDKPIGLSSNQALQKAKHLFQAAKAGHTGTLDPMATGVLPICFGEATKFSQYLTDSDKAYEATLQLGVTTTTGDAEGEVLSNQVVNCTEEQFKKVCETFVGVQMQTPPMYSALKFEGKPLYEYARAGITIERKSREVLIQSITVNEYRENTAKITVYCSKGTYIRTLAEDIGATLGCGAHLIGLRRIKTGDFTLAGTKTLTVLDGLSEEERLSSLHGIDQAIHMLPAVSITQVQKQQIQLGQTIKIEHGLSDDAIRLYDEQGLFLGLGEPKGVTSIKPKRLVVFK